MPASTASLQAAPAMYPHPPIGLHLCWALQVGRAVRAQSAAAAGHECSQKCIQKCTQTAAPHCVASRYCDPAPLRLFSCPTLPFLSPGAISPSSCFPMETLPPSSVTVISVLISLLCCTAPSNSTALQGTERTGPREHCVPRKAQQHLLPPQQHHLNLPSHPFPP